ncbi:MAG: peptidoglycan-associated lipoprotein, partial [Bacteroidetes bacterium]
MSVMNTFDFSKINFILILFIVITLHQPNLSAQTENTRIDELIEEGNFDEAIQIGTSLLSDDPNIPELNFKVGYSYLNTALRKAKSIPYLEKTVELLNEKESKTNLTFEAKFYLGKAYHNNYEFEKAIELYTKLRETTKNNELLIAIDKKINQCNVGIKLMKTPIKMQINNLSANINSPYSDHSPVITADEEVIIFTSRRKRFEGEKLNADGQYNEDIYISYNKNNSWQKPKGISPNINTEAHEASIGLSPDGQQLFIYSGANGGTILTSYLIGDEWSEPEILGPSINTRFRETHASMSANGRYLYFTSDRPGGYGGLDLYVSEKLEDGSWGKAKNLGPSINT